MLASGWRLQVNFIDVSSCLKLLITIHQRFYDIDFFCDFTSLWKQNNKTDHRLRQHTDTDVGNSLRLAFTENKLKVSFYLKPF